MENLTEQSLIGAKPFYDLCGDVVTNTNKNGVFAEVEKFNSGDKELTTDEYELLGSIAYFHGMQFTSQRNSFNKLTMENFQLRMKNFSIDLDFQEKCRNFIESVNLSVIVNGNEKMKSLIVSTLTTNSELREFIQENFKAIVFASTFKIGLSEQIYDLGYKEELSYSDILLMNKIIYDELDLTAVAFGFIEELWSNASFVAELSLASKYFDFAKFSVIYLDSIITLKEWFEEFPLLADTYIDVDTETIVDVVEPVIAPTMNVVSDKPTPKQTPTKSIDPNETDKFLRSVLMESSVGNEILEINNADDLILCIEKAFENEDVLPNVYKYIRANVLVNREDFASVYGFEMDEFIEKFNNIYLEKKQNYKEIVEEYLFEIDTVEHEKLITLVDDTIRSLVISGRENKGYLMQQLSENQIHTINHLHQLLGMIESCTIYGYGYVNYVQLVGYISIKTPKIQEVIEKIDTSDFIQMELKYYKAIVDFYNRKG